MKRYAAIGVDVHFSEVDIKCMMDSSTQKCQDDFIWDAESLQKQADFYSKLMKLCLEESNCEAFILWGYTDKYSWLTPE